MYLEEKKREKKKKSYRLVEDYLSSLGLEIELFWNENLKFQEQLNCHKNKSI